MSAPQEVNTTSKEPDSLSGRLSTSLCTKVARAERPTSSASARAVLIPSPEKSTPVTTAPRRAQLSVSRPKWHCRCSSVVPSPTSGPSSPSSMALSEVLPALNPATSYSSEPTWSPTASSQLARFALR